MVSNREMPGGPLIPDPDVALRPAVPELQVRILDMAIKSLQERLAVLGIETHDVSGELAIHVEMATTGNGMALDNFMFCSWIGGLEPCS
jgi:hypothetical protein